MKSRVLKFHRDVRQHVQRRLREVVGLVDAYGRGSAPRVHVRIPVAVALVFRIEQVVDQQAQPNAARRTGAERIGEVEVGHAVGVQRQGVVLVVGEILLADVLGVEHGFESAVVEIQEGVGDDVGRIGDGHVAQLFAVGGAILQCVDVVLDAVLREGGVGPHGEPPGCAPRGRQLHAPAVAVRDVGVEGVAVVVHHARRHELVLVLHVVEIHPQREARRRVLVAQLPVVELFRRGVGVVGREFVTVGEVGILTK